jgi:hypothetical protein
MHAFGEVSKHLGADLEVRCSYARSDGGHQVCGIGSGQQQPLDTFSSQMQGATPPSAVQEHGPGFDRIRHCHGKTVGMPHHRGLTGFQEEPVGIAVFVGFEDTVAVDLRRRAEFHGASQRIGGDPEIRCDKRAPWRVLVRGLEEGDAHVGKIQQQFHWNSARNKVRSSSKGDS